MNDQPIKIVLEKPKKEYGLLDLRRYIPSAGSREKTAWNLAGIFVMVLLIAGAVYGWYWLQTDPGQRFIKSAGGFIEEISPSAIGEKFIRNIKSMTSWETEDNPEKPKQGIILNSIEVIGSKRVPQGNDIMLRYNLGIEGTDASIPVDFYCRIKEQNISGEILPHKRITLSKFYPSNVRCRIPGKATSNIAGSQIIEAGGFFEFKTEGVTLPVYITSEEAYSQVRQNGNDFFEFYHLPETQPIRAVYNGEPVEIAIGVSDEGLQPVTIGESSVPFIGLKVQNKWSGKIKQITKLELVLPKEIQIDKETSPENICPFAFAGTRERKNVYSIPESYLNNLNLEKEDFATFECFLKIDPSIIGDALYTRTEYKANAEYIYALKPKTETVTIKA